MSEENIAFCGPLEQLGIGSAYLDEVPKLEAEVVVFLGDKDLALQHGPASLGKHGVHIEEHG